MVDLTTSNDPIKRSPSVVYPEAWVLVNSGYSQVETIKAWDAGFALQVRDPVHGKSVSWGFADAPLRVPEGICEGAAACIVARVEAGF